MDAKKTKTPRKKLESVTMQRTGLFSQGNRSRRFVRGSALEINPGLKVDFEDQGNQISPAFYEHLKQQKFI